MAASSISQRLLFASAFCFVAAFSLRAQDLPKKSATPEFDFEPRLMLNDLPDLPLPGADPRAPQTANSSLDVIKLEAELEKAKKNATWRERLYKSGVLSKVEAEQSALKIVRLARDLENARLQALKREIEEKRPQAEKDESVKVRLAELETALATASTTASAASAKWDEAQRAAAEIRVQRERKLYALGAGSRSSVKRAESALQSLVGKPAELPSNQ